MLRLSARYYLLLLPLFVAATSAAFYLVVRHQYLLDWQRHAIDLASNLNEDLLKALRQRGGHPPPPAEWEQKGLSPEVDRITRRYLRYLDVERINIFSRDGTLVYSTEPGLAPRPSLGNRKLERALAGGAVSDVESADESDFDEGSHSEDFLETYVPLRALGADGKPSGDIAGAFEVYQSVGAMSLGMRDVAWVVALGSAFVLVALGALLLAVSRRASRLVQAEREQQERLETALARTVANLEETVQQRTLELRQERELLSTVLDEAPSAFVLLDAEAKVLYASRQFRALLGGCADPCGKRCWEAWGCPTQGEQCAARRAVLEGCQRTQLQVIEQGGATRWLEHVAVPIRNGGLEVRAIEMITDVTARRSAEEQASRAGRLATAGELAAAVAHEVRNAATSTKLILQVWAEQKAGSGDPRSLEVALASIERMETLVSRLLRLSRPVQPEVVPVELSRVVRDAVDLVRPGAYRRGIRLVEHYPGVPCVCLGDAALINEALLNLLLNSVQAFEADARSGAEVEVAVRPDARRGVAIDIVDNGPGIPDGLLPRVFEPFFSSKPEGTGLGLPIARHIVGNHGGSLTLENRPGGGLAVHIHLPGGPPS
ncbi:MAG: PAS domain-containing protein [Myxococcales bacterium]|nr:PAS domain-containing protein [Myxococcales bacterium]